MCVLVLLYTSVVFVLFCFVVVWDVIEQGITVSVAAFMKMVLPEQYVLPLVDQHNFWGVLAHVEHWYIAFTKVQCMCHLDICSSCSV